MAHHMAYHMHPAHPTAVLQEDKGSSALKRPLGGSEHLDEDSGALEYSRAHAKWVWGEARKVLDCMLLTPQMCSSH